jgi:hypothetical protein
MVFQIIVSRPLDFKRKHSCLGLYFRQQKMDLKAGMYLRAMSKEELC